IEAAEHFGRMAMVDRWVIHNVLRWMETHEESVAKSDGFSINLSGNSLSDDSFLEFILGQFAASTIPPEMICFEITETAAITNLADAIEFIRVLKQTGCKFSLDDFGSGLSSYAYIQKLPVDFIKIDGVFIGNIANNERDQALVKSINELAHFMGMKTVAEYVENYEILNVLRTIGVDHSQGFGIKKTGLLEELA
ncbi:EAL domain-containing protein, partial [Oleiphilus sp. HI0061]